MTCWQCKAEAGDGPLCAACATIQPLPPAQKLFAALDLPESWFLDAKTVEDRFKELNKKLHPDRFAQKSPKERRLSLEWTTAVNDAYRILKDPVKRAIYLCKLSGIEVEREGGGSAMQTMAPDFLEEVMELREKLEDAKAAKDLVAVRALAKDVKGRADKVTRTLTELFERWEKSKEEKGPLERAAAALATLKYYGRFQEEVEAIEMAALEA